MLLNNNEVREPDERKWSTLICGIELSGLRVFEGEI